MTHEIAALRVAASNILHTVESANGIPSLEQVAQEVIGFVANGHLRALIDKSEKLSVMNAALTAERDRWAEVCKRAEAAEAELALLKSTPTPVAWTDEEELVEMRSGTCGTMFNGDHIDRSHGQWFPLYLHSQAKPVVILPQRHSHDEIHSDRKCFDCDEIIAAVMASGCVVKDN
ncbi:hypothetical protein ASE93_02020 [Serratia sp. Leaf50]|nr:hypothetical protein ASE93_02020 [Serratia sp. Leaf50]